ncbi:MAG: glycosyltransferase [Anaerolineae bacterium]|nr:glycosyltransferase [Anaerolineae bacterium]
MKIAYVSANDLLGQQFNGLQLTHALRKLNIDARLFVYMANGNWPEGIKELWNPSLDFLNRNLVALEKKFSSYGILPVYSIPFSSDSFVKQADIIHLQLFHGYPFFSLLSLPQLSRHKKIVLTLHDPWMATGHCVYPLNCERWKTGCGACPDLNRPIKIEKDRTAFNWKIKKNIFDHSNIQLVAASKWTLDIIKNSPLLSRFPCSLIPLGLNTKIFFPHDKLECRRKLGIPPNHKVIAFRSVREPNYKGMSYIREALLNLDYQEPITLLTVNDKGLMDELSAKYNIVEMGSVLDPEGMATILSASDVFLMPSIAESFGMMAVEAMACGAVPIVFEGTPLPDVIHAPECGLAVRLKDIQALGDALLFLLENPSDLAEKALKGRNLVLQEYKVEDYVRRHLELYYSLDAGAGSVAEYEKVITGLENACRDFTIPQKETSRTFPIWWETIKKITRFFRNNENR